MGQFLAKGGVAGLLPTLVIVVLWITVWRQQENSLHHPIGSIVGMILSLLVFYTLFSRRYSLRERAWASEMYHVPGPSLSRVGLGSLLTGLALMVTAVTLYKAWEVPTHFSQKLIFALVYSLAHVGFTIALTLMPLGSYLGKLNERVPQPIFAHTDRLLDIVLQTAARSLGNKRGSEKDEDIFKRFEVMEFSQSPADGGLQVLVRECKLVQLDLGSKPQITEDVWKIDADKWGRIRSLTPGTIRQRAFLSSNLDDSSHARLLPSGKPNSGN